MYQALSMILLVFTALVSARNDAINANPSDANIGLTTHGSDWLWAVFAVMLLSDLIFIAWSFRVHHGERLFHHLAIVVLTVTTIAYFSLASNLGSTPIRTEFRSNGATRAIWYVRFIDWVITFPLLLLSLLFMTGLALSEIVTGVFFIIAFCVLCLLGSLVASSYKWGFFTIAVFSLFYVIHLLLRTAHRSASYQGNDVMRVHRRGSGYLSLLWLIYPIAWALSEGSNTISVTGEMVWFGILDILLKPVFLFLHASSLRNIPYSTFGLTSGRARHADNGQAREMTHDVEKRPGATSREPETRAPDEPR